MHFCLLTVPAKYEIRDSSVSVTTNYGLDNGGIRIRFLAGEMFISSSSQRSDRLWDSPRFHGAIYPGLKRPRLKLTSHVHLMRRLSLRQAMLQLARGTVLYKHGDSFTLTPRPAHRTSSLLFPQNPVHLSRYNDTKWTVRILETISLHPVSLASCVSTIVAHVKLYQSGGVATLDTASYPSQFALFSCMCISVSVSCLKTRLYLSSLSCGVRLFTKKG
jgi:hypothetical protein